MEWLQKYLGGGTGTLLAGLGGAAAQNQIIKDIEGMGATDLHCLR